MLSKKKKVFILFGMVLLLVVTGGLNLYLTKNTEDVPTSTYQDTSLISSYRASKLETRQTMMSYYDSIISTSTDTEQITQTNALITELAGRMEKETVLEGMIMASGYEDAVVTNSDGFLFCYG